MTFSSLKGFVIDSKAPVEKNKLATANILQTITAWEGRYIYDFKQGNHTILLVKMHQKEFYRLEQKWLDCGLCRLIRVLI